LTNKWVAFSCRDFFSSFIRILVTLQNQMVMTWCLYGLVWLCLCSSKEKTSWRRIVSLLRDVCCNIMISWRRRLFSYSSSLKGFTLYICLSF
jgi:hypothetical protein